MPARRSLAVFSILLGAIAGLTHKAGAVRAAEPPLPSGLDCGPGRVYVGDSVVLNVGNPGRTAQDPAVLVLRLLDEAGQPLLEQTLTFSPGQSHSSVRWTNTNGAPQALVRGEVVVMTGPTDLQLVGTMQVFRPGLIYGPHFQCVSPAGDYGRDGPQSP